MRFGILSIGFPFCLFLLCFSLVANPKIGFAGDASIHLISAETPGGILERKGNAIVGAYPTFFNEASELSKVTVDYRIVPWARAVKETENSDSLLLFPFSRTPEREDRFNWITPLIKDPICFASPDKQINSLATARKLKRVLVWRGSSMETFLKQQGFTNLIDIASLDQVSRLFKTFPASAWYTVCDQAYSLYQAGKTKTSVKVGKSVASEMVWLVSSKSYVSPTGLNKFVDAINILRDKSRLNQLLEAAKQAK